MRQSIKLENFRFTTEDSQVIFSSTATILKISNDIQDERELFAAFQSGLAFPYFGWNWDALEDCLRDLSWIVTPQVVIAHDGLPSLPKSDILIYLSILSEKVDHWARDSSKEFVVIFPQRVEAEIRKLASEGAEQAKS